MSDIEKVISALKKVKEIGRGKMARRFQACCPAHDDSEPSLAVSLTHDDRVLLHCWAGCGGAEIVSALNLDWSYFMPEKIDTRIESVFGPRVKPKITESDCLLAIAKDIRKSGGRLTKEEKEKELRAYLKRK